MAKEQVFKVGDLVKHTDGDGRPYKVTYARYILYPNGEDWEYTLVDEAGNTKKELGSSLLTEYVQPSANGNSKKFKKKMGR